MHILALRVHQLPDVASLIQPPHFSRGIEETVVLRVLVDEPAFLDRLYALQALHLRCQFLPHDSLRMESVPEGKIHRRVVRHKRCACEDEEQRDERRQLKDSDGDAAHWWLRTPYSGIAYDVRFVYPDGSLDLNFAYYALGVAPACIIG